MQVVLEGLPLEAWEYVEGDDISFTCFTIDVARCAALSEALASGQRVLALQRDGQQLAVRASEHEVTPPCSRRMDVSLHRHEVRLQVASPVVLALAPLRPATAPLGAAAS